MRMFLSALGWVTDGPAGNRLRWTYPFDLVADGGYLGLPETLVIERAEISADFLYQSLGQHAPVGVSGTPMSWWEPPDQVALQPLESLPLKLVQGVSFTYRGPAARITVHDAMTDTVVFDQVVLNDTEVLVGGSLLDEVGVLTFAPCVLDRFQVIDLFADHGELPWRRIAEIGVAATLGAQLGDVAVRYAEPPTLQPGQWDELIALAADAQASSPTAAPSDRPSPWQELAAAVGVRWEHAVLFGAGAFDGPRTEEPPLDGYDLGLAAQGPGLTPATSPFRSPLAYRIVEPAGRLEVPRSNAVFVPAFNAPDLASPAGLTIEGQVPSSPPEVALTTDGFVARYALRWSDADPRAIGVAIDDEVGASATAGTPASTDSYVHRTRTPGDPPGGGRVARRRPVASYDVSVTATARAVDGWDRESTPSIPSTSALTLRHSSVPPPLAWGERTGTSVTLHRWFPATPQDGDPWTPDQVVLLSGGVVDVLRRIGVPAVADVTVGPPFPVDGRYSVRLVSPPAFDAASFVGGWLLTGSARVRVDWAGAPDPNGTELRFDTLIDGSNPVVFGAGPARLMRDPGAPDLWQVVATFPATGLPAALTFEDAAPAMTEGVVTGSYATRVAFLGRNGPLSAPVVVTLVPSVPPVPPPFTVTPLGRDFYSRTLVKIVLTDPVPGGIFSVRWADGIPGDPGWPAGTRFDQIAVAGEYASQPAVDGTTLYDVLSLPIPPTGQRQVTIGLQAVNVAGGQSGFITVPYSVEAAPARP